MAEHSIRWEKQCAKATYNELYACYYRESALKTQWWGAGTRVGSGGPGRSDSLGVADRGSLILPEVAVRGARVDPANPGGFFPMQCMHYFYSETNEWSTDWRKRWRRLWSPMLGIDSAASSCENFISHEEKKSAVMAKNLQNIKTFLTRNKQVSREW